MMGCACYAFSCSQRNLPCSMHQKAGKDDRLGFFVTLSPLPFCFGTSLEYVCVAVSAVRHILTVRISFHDAEVIPYEVKEAFATHANI